MMPIRLNLALIVLAAGIVHVSAADEIKDSQGCTSYVKTIQNLRIEKQLSSEQDKRLDEIIRDMKQSCKEDAFNDASNLLSEAASILMSN